MSVELKGLTKRYGEVTAADGIDLEITAGEVVALLGPNGAGKTTTMEMMLGLVSPDHGQALLFGQTPAKAIARGRAGAMLQSGGFLGEMTGREIVSVMAAQFPKPLKIDDVLSRAGALGYAKAGYGGLSGGQKQRIRFAAALVCDPDLLVLDEPTVAMDVQGRQAFWAAMRDYTGGGRTVVFATHYLAEAQEFADRVVLMRQGRVVADGSVAEICARVDGRTISVVIDGADAGELRKLPGVGAVDIRGSRVELHCAESDLALRGVLTRYPTAHDISVTAMSLEDAFLALTTGGA